MTREKYCDIIARCGLNLTQQFNDEVLGAGARPGDDEATATREKTRSIGHGCVIDDYVFDRGSAWGRLRPPPEADIGSKKEWQRLADWRVAGNEGRGLVTTGRALREGRTRTKRSKTIK